MFISSVESIIFIYSANKSDTQHNENPGGECDKSACVSLEDLSYIICFQGCEWAGGDLFRWLDALSNSARSTSFNKSGACWMCCCCKRHATRRVCKRRVGGIIGSLHTAPRTPVGCRRANCCFVCERPSIERRRRPCKLRFVAANNASRDSHIAARRGGEKIGKCKYTTGNGITKRILLCARVCQNPIQSK